MKTVLQTNYERIAGCEISSRTWRRIKQRLSIFDESSFGASSDTQAYAELRVENPRTRITLLQVREYNNFIGAFRDCVLTDTDIKEIIDRHFTRKPTLRTLYRWGKQIGVPFEQPRLYNLAESKLWLKKLYSMREKYNVS